MASPQATAESVRDAVRSTSTCTFATVTILSDLLLPKITSNPKDPANSTRKPFKSAIVSKTAKPVTTKEKGRRVSFAEQDKGRLSTKEKSILATEVINATLKSLSEAIKKPTRNSIRLQPSSRELTKARKPLSRTNTAPQSPLQPRSLNRVASSPSLSSRHSKSSSSASIASSGLKSTGQCARIAFACLRALQATKTPGIDLPPLQIENGMSVLIGKLITLGFDDLATKELKILKNRLYTETLPKKTASLRTKAPDALDSLAEILDFGTTKLTGAKLSLAISSQLYVLRLMTSPRKQKSVEAALPVLDPSYPSSPTSLLLFAAEETKSPEKVCRQLQSLSDLLLSLCPSISSADDALAVEPRLSVTPESSFQLQALALHNRILWWNLAGHQANVAKDFFDPFLRCLSTFARRNRCNAHETYRIASAAFVNLKRLLPGNLESLYGELRPFLAGISRVFSSLAQEANLIEEAVNWTLDLKRLFDAKLDSDAKGSFIVARLVALKLRNPPLNDIDDLVLTLLEMLERPFKGESSEIDDLMTEMSFARRAAISALAGSKLSPKPDSELTERIRQMCESLVFMCLRLCLRYLGKPPDLASATKEIVRHEQRRQFISKSGLHSIDSALFLLKNLLTEDRSTWELLDSKLQDCLSLLDKLDLKIEDSNPSYYVRISNLYYSQFLNERRSERSKDAQKLRILRRSIDCVRTRSQADRKAALVLTKLERMAEIQRQSGRYDDLFKTLTDTRDEMVKNGVLSGVASAAASQPLRRAWDNDDNSAMLARTLQNLLKIQLKYVDSSLHTPLVDESWADDEKGAVLEYQLQLLSVRSTNTAAAWNLQAQTFEKALLIYSKAIYPLRRLRVLTRLQCHDVDLPEAVANILKEELQTESIKCCNVEGTKDKLLQGYLHHLQNLAISTTELTKSQPRVDVLKRCLIVWSNIRNVCQDLSILECQIEDIRDLLDHLQSIADYLQIKGSDHLRVAVLRLISDLTEQWSPYSSPDEMILSLVSLGSQWLQIGYSGRAWLVLDKAEHHDKQNGIAISTSMQLHLTYSEYMLHIGNFDKCEEHLARAQALFIQGNESRSERVGMLSLEERNNRNLLMSAVYSIYSKLALERGFAHVALDLSRQSTRLVRRAWAYTEEHTRRGRNRSTAGYAAEIEKTVNDSCQFSLSTTSIQTDPVVEPVTGSSFWPLVTPLYNSLNHLASVYAHHGMFQESLYYVDQGYQLMKQVGAETHHAMAAALKADLLLKSGDLGKGAELLAESKEITPVEKGRDNALLLYQFGKMHGLLGDRHSQLDAYRAALEAIQALASSDCIESIDHILDPSDTLEAQMSRLTLSKPQVPLTKRKTVARPKAKTKSKTSAHATTTGGSPRSISRECHQLMSLKGMVLRQKSRALMDMNNFAESLAILNEATEWASQLDIVDRELTMAKNLLCQSMEQMAGDPVYSVLQDSTISFPSVLGPSKIEKVAERLSVSRTSPPRKIPSARDRVRSKSPVPESFLDHLSQAQDRLIESHSVAISIAPISVVHNISALLSSVSILLSAAAHLKGKGFVHPGFASSTIEMARTLALRREHKAIHTDVSSTFKLDDSCWPTLPPADSRRSSSELTCELLRFQRDYVDIIPKSWTAISISLSDSRNELSITKLQAGHSPFVLRLPLGRHNSMDADEEVFGFEQGRSELNEIIELANESAHDARDMNGKEAKTAWWEEREALDSRLRDLLENIEKVWLGGFTGIFSQHNRRPELLSRFQKSFQSILDRHLPSRSKKKKKNAGPRINLDSQILDLFIGLGDASAEDADFSEPLTDLLYFVVDILQFHGELNAYAEIDFDSMVVETGDALCCYHEAANSLDNEGEGKHTILILDKALHAFPWESLPCMEGQPVSRLPSLGCLRDRILQSQHDVSNIPEGCYAKRDCGAFILNPDGDLKNTQATFGKALQALPGWDSTIKRAPTEEEFSASLKSKDIFLYFGHGSGAQYIRSREIRKLETCAVTFLMGCSSGALHESGEFEPYGPAINYMHAGSPALVATLWDVTDKDIDRFAKVTLEHWGLFEQVGEGKKVKRKKKAGTVEVGQLSVVEAVVKGREACKMKYLNAAAVCVYGVPVYLN